MKISVIEEMLYAKYTPKGRTRKISRKHEIYGELSVVSEKLSHTLNEEQKGLLNEYTSAVWVFPPRKIKNPSLWARDSDYFSPWNYWKTT